MVEQSSPLTEEVDAIELPFDPPLVIEAVGRTDREIVATGLQHNVITSTSAIDGLALSTFNPETGRAHLMYVSENLAAMLGHSPFELLGRSPEVLIAEDTPLPQLSAIAAIVESGQQAVVNLRLRHSLGHTIGVRASFLLVPSLPGEAPHFLALYRSLAPELPAAEPFHDHSELLDSLVRGQELSEVLRQVADRIGDQIRHAECWVVLADQLGQFEPTLSGSQRNDTVLEVHQYLTESGGHSTPRCLRWDDFPTELALELDDRGVHAVWSFPFAGSNGRMSGRLLVAHGDRAEPHPAERQMLRELSGVLAVAVQRSASEASLAHQALHDPLTQLPNRALIVDRLEQAVARLGRDNTRLAALLVDLDRFKNLNDTRGPDVGDEVLLEVARRLRRSVRLGDTVGRIGGDQFLMLCVAMNDEADASAMAERIVGSLAAPLAAGPDLDVSISASVGVVLVDRPGQSPASIISSAESALAKAIESGRGGFAVYEEGWQRKVVIRHEVEQALQVAITEDELLLHYQPIVDMRSGRMAGAEALIRWDRPGHGLLPPGDFIEIAEETGLIVPVGAWVIDQVCSELSKWPTGPWGNSPFISVNLSARQLADDTLIGTVLGAMDRHGTMPEQLAFEVTESMRVEDLEMATVALRKLSALGCKVSIDDFGIGYATLDYLRRFSMADTIKIDRSFVDGLGESREDTAIVTASVALAASLGLTVVAEGVETTAQYRALAGLDCEYAQGYLLSKPVPLEDVHRLWITSKLIDLD